MSPRAGVSRRQLLQRAAGAGALALGGGWLGGVRGPSHGVAAAAVESADQAVPEIPLTVITGNARERGRSYGKQFKDAIAAFVEREVHQAYTGNPSSRQDLLRYAGACAGRIKAYSPEIMDELEGVAEGTGLRLEDLVLLTLHEELFHRGQLPPADATAPAPAARKGHCTVLAAGPPDTSDGDAYVGQTWDWMTTTYGHSSMLRWERQDGPSLLGYAYPGLWVGAGLNSAGLAFGWTSAFDKDGIKGPRVGIPSYVLLTQMLYQATLDDAVEEVRRAGHAGWFTVVLVDGDGEMASLEGSPAELAVERTRGRCARNLYGGRRMTRTADGADVPYTDRCRRMLDLLAAGKGTLDRAALQGFLHDPAVFVPRGEGGVFTVDQMLFNTTRREAYVKRGPAGPSGWKRFAFADAG